MMKMRKIKEINHCIKTPPYGDIRSLKNRVSFFVIICFGIISIFGFNHKKKIALQEIAHRKQFFQQIINQNTFPDWMLAQVEADLSYFKKHSLSKQIIDAAVDNYLKSSLGRNNTLHLARCHIQNGKISIQDLHPPIQTASRLSTILQAFSRLMYLTPIPDTDFIICVGDSLAPEASLFFYHIPILTFAKHTQDTLSVLIPDCEALSESVYEKVLADTTNARISFPWHTKETKAFWRGATTGSDLSGNIGLNSHNYREFPRIKLVELSSKYPHLIDAKLSILAQVDDPRVYELLTPYVGHSVPVLDHLKYKYQLLIDGNTCTYSRAYWQLFSDCLIFKQTSPHIQWYYNCLQPYVHYIPIAHDLSDLVEKIEWAKEHDIDMQKIAANANAFAQQNLTKDQLYLYLYLFLSKYSDLFQR